jgi:hypothetical protein
VGEFDYLKRFVSKEESSHPNWFTPLDESAVAEAEGRIGFRFPPSLRSFYLEIGSGFLATNEAGDKKTTSVNRFLTPAEVADLYLGDSELMPPEGFEAGELPVFEVGSDLFLVMRLAGGREAGIFRMSGTKVADNFSDFVRRLYYEDPRYYVQVTDAA